MSECRKCNEELGWSNIATEKGKLEVGISGICEKCFDNITFDLESGLHRLDKGVCQMVENIPSLVLAGGALRSLVDSSDTILDYDLFLIDSPEKETCKKNIIESWERSPELGRIVFKCPQGKLYTFKSSNGVKIQLIDKRPYKSCEDLVSSFDMTACSAVWDGVSFYKHERFIFDVLHKRLNMNSLEYPVATLKRLMKYQAKGYKLTNEASRSFIDVVSREQWSEDDLELYID